MKDFREAFPTPDCLDDDGIRNLRAAIILQAASDFCETGKDVRRNIGRILELNRFLHSDWYKCLTDMPYGHFINTMAEYLKPEKNFKVTAYHYRRAIQKETPEPYHQDGYDPQWLTNLLNNKMYAANCLPEKEYKYGSKTYTYCNEGCADYSA